MIVYQDLLDSGLSLSSVFFACRAFDQKRHVKKPIMSLESVYQWATQGIPRRFVFLITNIYVAHTKRKADKAATAAARAPQVDIFAPESLIAADKSVSEQAFFSIENNDLHQDLSGLSAPTLANNRQTAVALEPRAFQKIEKLPKEHIDLRALKGVLEQHIDKMQVSDAHYDAHYDTYARNVDAMSYAYAQDAQKNPYLEAYYLSGIVQRIERYTKVDTFKQMRIQGGVVKQPKHSLGAHNCGRRVMGEGLREKIFGDDAPKGAVDVISCDGKLSYKGVMICKDAWGCPCCARKITERRKRGLSLLLDAHVAKYGGNSIAATLFTIPHGLGDDLDDILTRMHKAWRYMTMDNGYKHLMATYGLRGSVRGLESTYGKHGFHPHFHVLYFFDRDIKKPVEGSIGGDIEHIKHSLFNIWSRVLRRFDFAAPSFQAFGCVAIGTDKRSLEDVAKYFGKGIDDINQSDIDIFLVKHKDTVREVDGTKQRWGIESELTKWHIKSGGQWRYSMLDFLRGFAISDLQGNVENRDIFKNLWLTYRRGFKGRRQLYTHHKDFKIPELVLSDAEVADLETTEEKFVLCSIEFEDWTKILRCNARSTVLNLLYKGKSLEDILSILMSFYSG
jgi:hypothetical protein